MQRFPPPMLACLVVLFAARAAVAGSITTVAGSAGAGPALAVAQVPDAVAVHGAFIYVADYFSAVVLRLDTTTGQEAVVAGTGGGPSFGGDGGPATAAQLAFPIGVAVDTAGNLAIADQDNNRIRLVDATTGVITTVAGKESFGFSGDGGPATAAELNLPAGVTFGATGDLFIADQLNNRIRRVDATTGTITTVAGTGTAGLSGDGGPATAAQLNYPYSVAIDAAGNLFIVDPGNNRIRRVDATTGIITTVAGTGTAGFSGDGGPATAAQLNNPSGVAFDAAQNLFMADRFNSRIRRVDAATGIITTVAGDGTFGFGGDGGPATAAQLNYPYNVAIDAAGSILIPDAANERLRRVDAGTGVITTIAGNGTPSFGGDGGPAAAAQIGFVPGVAVDRAGNLFIVDHNDSRIRRVDATTGIITTAAGNGTFGFSGDGGPATAAQITDPLGIALDASGDLFIADTLRVRRVDASTDIITTVAGNGTCCFSGDGGPATAAGLDYGLTVALDAAGNIYTAEPYNNHRVRRVDAITGIITTVAGNGTQGFSGDGGPATAAQLNTPVSVAVDAAGNVFIGDSARVRRVDATSGVITTVAGNGTFPPSSGDGGPATAARLTAGGLAFDAAGNLFIADQYSIRRVDVGTGIIGTVAGDGTTRGFSGDGGPATGAEFNAPFGLAFDGAGDLFIADEWNYRIRRVSAPVACGDGVVETSEQCDDGAANGTVSSCCTAMCQFQSGGMACADDGNLCTSDVCDGVSHCTHPFEPATNCTLGGSGGASLKIANNPKSSAKFKWTKGPAIELSDFGTPNGGTFYELCIYDEDGGVPSDMYRGQPGGPGVCGRIATPCWKQLPTGWKFKSKTGAPDGITGVTLKARDAGRAKVQMSAKNNLALGAFPLQASPHVVAQVRTSTGQCWGANFSAAGIKRNDTLKFVGKSD